MDATAGPGRTGEHRDLLDTLAKHRWFLRYTARDLTDEQAARRTTPSELCIGGLIKHVADVEARWVAFMLGDGEAITGGTFDDAAAEAWAKRFTMSDGETLPGLLQRYEEVARSTDEAVATVADLDATRPLPAAPWFEPGARWSARRVLLHVIAETAQHAGHADIIREALDGSKTMG
jgi:hypothetical protein